MRISDWSSDVCSSDLVQVEDDLAERVTGFLEADARARFFERDLLQAHGGRRRRRRRRRGCRRGSRSGCRSRSGRWCWRICDFAAEVGDQRSEEHTSELQSLMRISYAVFCLKKKKKTITKKERSQRSTTENYTRQENSESTNRA